MNNYAYVDGLFCEAVGELISDYFHKNRREMQGGVRIDYPEIKIDWVGPSQWANDFGIDG